MEARNYKVSALIYPGGSAEGRARLREDLYRSAGAQLAELLKTGDRFAVATKEIERPYVSPDDPTLRGCKEIILTLEVTKVFVKEPVFYAPPRFDLMRRSELTTSAVQEIRCRRDRFWRDHFLAPRRGRS